MWSETSKTIPKTNENTKTPNDRQDVFLLPSIVAGSGGGGGSSSDDGGCFGLLQKSALE